MKHIARKRFGQNFLVDPAIPEQIVAAIAPQAEDALVEIGPGLGALTLPLSRRVSGTLDVVELDRDLVERLLSRRDLSKVVVHESDALRFDFEALSEKRGRKLRVVGNLPYNISSPLLFHLLEARAAIVDQHFMLQKEVVERMVAAPGESAFGRLSVMLQVAYDMELLFEVAPESFDPAPEVTSAVVRMQPLSERAPEILDPALFERVVRDAFGQRRKMIRNTLGAYSARVSLESVGIAPTLRPEDVSPLQYVEFANRLARQEGAPAAAAPDEAPN